MMNTETNNGFLSKTEANIRYSNLLKKWQALLIKESQDETKIEILQSELAKEREKLAKLSDLLDSCG